MTADTNAHTQSLFTSDPKHVLASSVTEACINWSSVTVPDSTTFDPLGASELFYLASTSVTCDDPENADFSFSLYLTGSDKPGKINDPKQSQTFLAFTGTTDLSTHQIKSQEFPFPSVFTFPKSSDLNVSYVYQAKVVDENKSTLVESALFYLERGVYLAPTPCISDSSGSSQGLSIGASAGLTLGLILGVALLALGGRTLHRLFLQRSVVQRRRASVRASSRHLGRQESATQGLELQRMAGRVPLQADGQHGEPLPQQPPPPYSSLPRYVYTSDSPPAWPLVTPGRGYESSPRRPRSLRPRNSSYDSMGPYGSSI